MTLNLSDLAFLTVARAATSGVIATGGTESIVNISGINYRLHTFTSSSSLVVLQPITVSYLNIAGGAGGGYVNTGGVGGGGAGGFLEGSIFLPPGTYPITIGLGGIGAAAGPGTNGGNTSAFGLTSIGGGVGGGLPNGAGSGGSGGGAGATGSAGSGTAGQGNSGGQPGGGGGGANAPGANGAAGATGGAGKSSSITGTATNYCGGGGGIGSGGVGAGGLGGGGAARIGVGPGNPGTAPGAGGGAIRSNNNGQQTAGRGADGILHLRYPI